MPSAAAARCREQSSAGSGDAVTESRVRCGKRRCGKRGAALLSGQPGCPVQTAAEQLGTYNANNIEQSFRVFLALVIANFECL